MPSAAESPTACSGCSRAFDLGERLLGSPFIGGIPGEHFAVLANHDGAEGVIERSRFPGRDSKIEELLHRIEFAFGRSGEFPVCEFLRAAAVICCAIRLQNLRS